MAYLSAICGPSTILACGFYFFSLGLKCPFPFSLCISFLISLKKKTYIRPFSLLQYYNNGSGIITFQTENKHRSKLKQGPVKIHFRFDIKNARKIGENMSLLKVIDFQIRLVQWVRHIKMLNVKEVTWNGEGTYRTKKK